MSDMGGLVSVLSAHLDKVEHEARSTEPGPWGAWPAEMPGEWYVATRNSRTGGPNSHRVATAQGLYAAEQNAAWVASWHPETVLGLVRATRDLIELRREAWEAGNSVQMTSGEWAAAVKLDQVIEQLARGWGVTDDKEDRDG